MSDNPYQLGTGQPEAPQPVRPPPTGTATKPQSALILGIIGIVLGGMGVLGSLYAVLQNFVIPAQNNWEEAMRMPAVYFIPATLVELGMTAWLLVASIKLLSGRERARRGYVTFCLADLVVTVLVFVYPLIHTIGALDADLSDIPPPVRAMVPVIAIGSLGLGLFFGLLFPAIALIILSRPGIKAGFQAYDSVLAATDPQ